MSLRLPKAAAEYFVHIREHPLPGVRFMDIDKYYACLMLGLKASELGREDELAPQSFLAAGAGYPDAYKPAADLIAGLLVDAEIRRNNIDPKDRNQIENETVKLLEPRSAMGLSDTGASLLNRYAARGFEHLQSELTAPRSFEVFLVEYARILDALDVQ